MKRLMLCPKSRMMMATIWLTTTGMSAVRPNARSLKTRCERTARQAECEEPDITQHIAQQARDVVVGIPESAAEIDQRVLLRIVEKQHQHRTDAHHDIIDRGKQYDSHSAETSCRARRRVS